MWTSRDGLEGRGCGGDVGDDAEHRFAINQFIGYL